MKKFISFFISIIVFILFTGCSPNKTQVVMQNTLSSEWNTFSASRKNFDGGLAMQVISPKGEYFISTKMPKGMSNKWHFRAASCTKTFTAAAIMLLNQQGKLNIDDKIAGYLPATSDYDIPYKDQITIRMLLMHRAGIFDVSNQEIKGENYIEHVETANPNHQFTFDELVGVVAKNKLSNFKPGTKYQYSNTGYSILGKIIEQVTGTTYQNYVTNALLRPNKLYDSIMVADAKVQDLPSPYVRSYSWYNNTLTDVTISNMTPHVAEGNITTTPHDLAKWTYKLLKGQAGLNAKTVEMMKNGLPAGKDPKSTYGLGIGHSTIGGYGHSGAHAGYLTVMSYNPDTDVAYVIFSNVWDVSKGLPSLMDQIYFMIATANKVLLVSEHT